MTDPERELRAALRRAGRLLILAAAILAGAIGGLIVWLTWSVLA